MLRAALFVHAEHRGALGNQAVIEFTEYLKILVKTRRQFPGDPSSDVLSRLIQGEKDGEKLTEPELLVLDEPTNYLDFKGLAWLEGFLQRTVHAYIVVSHDRYLLDRVVDQVWELDRGDWQD